MTEESAAAAEEVEVFTRETERERERERKRERERETACGKGVSTAVRQAAKGLLFARAVLGWTPRALSYMRSTSLYFEVSKSRKLAMNI
jgi:hypothetical protein